MINNVTISDDEVVASYGPSWSLFDYSRMSVPATRLGLNVNELDHISLSCIHMESEKRGFQIVKSQGFRLMAN